MLDNFKGLFKKMAKKDDETVLPSSGNAARERLHLVLMQDRVNVSVEFIDMMKDEIIEVIKKYIDFDEEKIDVGLTNQINEDGSYGSPVLYANIPIVGLRSDEKKNKINSNNLSNVVRVDNIDNDEPVDIEKKESIVGKDEDKVSEATPKEKVTRKVAKKVEESEITGIDSAKKDAKKKSESTITKKRASVSTAESKSTSKKAVTKADKIDEKEENIKKATSVAQKRKVATKKTVVRKTSEE